jgi:hypothetical protein
MLPLPLLRLAILFGVLMFLYNSPNKPSLREFAPHPFQWTPPHHFEEAKMPRYTQPRKTGFYLVNFKIKVVELSLRDDVMSKDIAEALGIHSLKAQGICDFKYQNNRISYFNISRKIGITN